MKKLILLVCLLVLLCGCSDSYKLKKVGYTKDDIEFITYLSDTLVMRFKEEYNEQLLSLVKCEGFKEENIDEYLKYYDSFTNEKLIYLVNEKIVNESNLNNILTLMKDEYFLVEKTNEYLNYQNKYLNLRTLIEAVNSNACYGQYNKSYETDLSKGYLVLLNKFYSLPSDYVPDDLVTVDRKYTKYNVSLRKECYEAYMKMYEDGLKEGMDLSINSAFRSYDLQYESYYRFCNIDPVEVVDTYSARPGHSEHQTGLAIDIIAEGSNFDNFHLTKEAKWLKENCDKYGFIVRYPEDKTNVTLYKYEAWHVRYVGDEANKIKESGLTFDEYYAVYLEN